MILALLHLSDIHLKASARNPIADRVKDIVSALRSSEALIDSCVVVVSGDIAFSGKSEEYRIAQSFFEELKASLKASYGDCPVVFVPGNHDCDFALDSDLRQAALKSAHESPERLELTGRVIPELLSIQKAYFQFCAAVSPGLTSDPWIIATNTYEIQGRTVKVLTFNTAFVSQIDEQKGTLVFPTHDMPVTLHGDEGATIVLSVFHHPYGWLNEQSSSSFKTFVEANSDVVLTGHEHLTGAYTKENVTGERLEYIEGAVLQTKADSHTGFNVVLCNAADKVQKLCNFAGLTESTSNYRKASGAHS
jgi:Calcineurin-like phosphoesterase